MSKQAYPLAWPAGWKRTSNRAYGKFGKRVDNGNWKQLREVSVGDGIERILREMQALGISRGDIVISTNMPIRLDGLPRSDAKAPSDPGAAIYWQERGKPMRCMAVDRYTRVADNLAAIAATLEAMRAIDRHGGAEILDRTFTGFLALPEKASQPWRDVLGIEPDGSVNTASVELRYRELVKIHHPDVGGNEEIFRRITEARDNAKRELSEKIA